MGRSRQLNINPAMNNKAAFKKDKEREESGFYESGLGKIQCDKWLGTFNKLPVSTQQQILDYAESVAIQFESNARRKVLHITAQDIYETMPPERPIT